MARLFTSGFETGAATGAEFTPSSSIPAGSVVTSPVRSGTYAGQISAASKAFVCPITWVSGRSYYARAYIRFAALPTGASAKVLSFGPTAASATVAVSISTSGVLTIDYGTGSSAALSVDTWYLVEARVLIGTGAVDEVELRVNGTTVASATGQSITDTLPGEVRFGRDSSDSSTWTCYYDDVAVNDNQGSSQASWPGDGSVALLTPVSDSSRGSNWTAGAGGTTNLWDATNNTPPVGVALASATNTSQIKNAAKDTTGVYAATCATYDTVVPPAAAVTLVTPVASIGNSTGTARSMGLSSTANPSTTEVTGSTNATFAADTFPANWLPLRGTPAYGDTVARATAPVVQIRKNASTTDSCMACFMAMLVEYVPPVAGEISISSITVGTNTGTSATVSVTTSESPVATAVGDVVLVLYVNDFYALSNMGTPTATGSPTLTPVTNGTADAGTNGAHIKSYTYTVNTAGAQTISATETGTHDEEKTLIAIVFQNVDTSNPVDDAANSTSGSASAQTCPSVSPSTATAFVIGLVSSGGGAAVTGYSTTALVEQVEYHVNGAMSGMLGTKQLSASGATGTFAVTASGSVAYGAVTIAMRQSTGATAVSTPPLVPYRRIQHLMTR